MKKLISQNYKALKSMLRCVGLIIPMIWMIQEWAWFTFLILFFVIEILTLSSYLIPKGDT